MRLLALRSFVVGGTITQEDVSALSYFDAIEALTLLARRYAHRVTSTFACDQRSRARLRVRRGYGRNDVNRMGYV